MTSTHFTSPRRATIAQALFLALAIFLSAGPTFAQNPESAQRYMNEAEYYQRQATSYQNDADYYLRQAKSAESDAAYNLRNKRYDRACDDFRRAANAMDNYQSKLNYARNAASRAEDYLRKAADALR